MLKLTDLNTDCLLKIFQYCSERELVALCRANVFLCGIIESHIFYGLTQDLVMCGHRNSPSIEERNNTQLTYWERLKVSKNWVSGTYQERPYYHHAQMFPTKLCLERDNLYITHTRYLRRYRRSSTDGLQRRYEEEIRAPTNSDISDFVKKDDTLFAGRVCGTCFVWDPEEGITEQKMHQASEYLYCVDFVNELYATSTDKCCKVWHRSQEFGLTHFDLVVQLPQHSFKSLKLSSDGQWLYGGLYTDKERRALRAIHIESGEEVVFNSNTISIYDLKIKDDNILFTANFDTTFRLFDRRIDRDVAIYEDPFDSSFYCLEYDGLYGVLCGTNRHARVNLYDIRMPKYVQLYFPGRTRQHNSRSPVYSLACDSRYMFVATDHNLRVFDFKTNCGTQRDYANMYDQTQRYIKV